MTMRLAIVIPVLDEEAAIGPALARLAPLRARGATVVVVDGGSGDRTVENARPSADAVLVAPRGRAAQMNAGARAALADPQVQALVFLHADTRLPEDADRAIAVACGTRAEAWGRFDVRIEGRSPLLAVVATMMNLRSRLTGIATGDQCLFATRALFERIGGFPVQPLMEDVEFSRRARRVVAPVALRDRATTSGRRWERHGVLKTVLLMWRLRFAYFLGADPARLATAYRDAR
jgi:rSAM/selenodomain-associated transferase 2